MPSRSMLTASLLDRVLTRLGLAARPEPSLEGLNGVYAAFSRTVSSDNIQKRIWLVGDRSTPVIGGDPVEFFENWLTHGTGGTCWPINGAMFALVEALGFRARRIACTMMIPGAQRGDANHGSVVVAVEGVDYLADAQIAAFQVLPLLTTGPSQTNTGIHAIAATPTDDGVEVRFYPGHNRENVYTCMTEPEMDPVDHAFFLSHYDRSAKGPRYSPFNEALVICRHFPDSILTIHRGKKIAVAADGSVTSVEVDDAQRREALVEEFGVSEVMAEALPPDQGIPGLGLAE